jgi:hypothetical protein
MEAMDFPEGDGRWFCPSCVIEKVSPALQECSP